MGSELFYLAFMELSSSRSIGVAAGPIPWHAVHLWCEANEITGEQREDVFYHVERLDKSYLDWLTKKHKPKPPGSQSKPKESRK